MKNLILLLIGLFVSCKSDYVKVNEKIKGSWALTSFEYFNPNGQLVSDRKSSYIIKFANDKKGAMLINTKEFILTHDFGSSQFDSGYAICDIDVENDRLLPIEAIGKVQVYSYKFINKTTLEFYVDKEYDFTNEQILTAVKYRFVRI